MAKEVKLPEISENIHEATVVNLLVAEGDDVKEDQPLLEIETDKALSELPSPISGKVKEIKVKEGDEVEVGSLLMLIEENGEGEEESSEADEEGHQAKEEEDNQDEQKDAVEKASREEEEEKEEKDEKNEEKEEKEEEPEEDKREPEDVKDQEKGNREEEESEEEKETSTGEQAESAEREDKKEKEEKKQVPASPSVRRFAREIGVDIGDVEGTGPGNRILVEDVKAFAKEKISGDGSTGMGGMGLKLPDFSKWGETERKPLSKVREITAENTWKSWNASPHVTQFDKADITNLEEFRKKYSPFVEKKGGKLTMTAILLKIAGFALQQFPRFNSSIDMSSREIIFKKYYNIGVAVDTDRGLLVPVVSHVDRKSLTSLAVELGELADKARNKKISPDELEGGNFVISNLGGIGGTQFTPVIFPPQVAILGVSRAEVQPVYSDGEFIPRTILPLNVSYDHKVIDGADGARFLRWMCEALENPLSIFMGMNE